MKENNNDTTQIINHIPKQQEPYRISSS